jgi:hypothetical protein
MAATLSQQIDETFDQLDNIESLCKMFESGNFTIYKSISASLRLLLTGSSGHAGLFEDVLPAGHLWRLLKVPDPSTPPEWLVLPAAVRLIRGEASIQVGNGTVTVQNLNVCGGAVGAMEVGEMFDNSTPPLPLKDWLDQSFLRPDWTVRQFIGVVTNKDGGAHHDPNSKLLTMQKWGHIHWHLTTGIARSILPQIRSQLSIQHPHHARPVR